MKYEVRMFCGKEGFAALEPQWLMLQKRLPHARFFHYAGWYKSRIENAEQHPDSVFFVYISMAGKPVAIFPLRYVTVKRWGVALRAFELYWPNDMGVCDSVFVKTDESWELLNLLVDYLRNKNDRAWDVILLPGVLEDSNTLFALCAKRDVCTSSVLHHYSKYIECGASYDSVMSRVSGSFKRNIRRQSKKLKSLGDVRFRFVASVDELDSAFEKFLEAEASSWKGSEGSGTAVTLSQQSTRFYRGLMTEFAADGACLIGLILIDGRCIASQFSLCVGGTIYLLKIGYDAEYRSMGPGNVLMDELIRRYCDKVDSISFVTGADWNDCWAPGSINVYNCSIYNRTSRGVIVCVMDKLKNLGRRFKWALNDGAPHLRNT